MNNIELSSLVQNSAEFKLIVYSFASNIYELSKTHHIHLLATAIVTMLVFVSIVYFLDMKKANKQKMSVENNVEQVMTVNNTSEQEKTVEKISEPTQTTLVSSNIEVICEKISEQSKTNQLVSNNIKTICEEIAELKKELASIKILKPSKTNTKSNGTFEANEDLENSNHQNSNSDNDSDSDTNSEPETVSTLNLNKTNMEKLISSMTISEIETLLQICSNHVLIPNWYTKEDFEGLINARLSTRTWENILDGDEDYSSLIDETNAMAVGWFENNVAPKLNQVPLSMQSIEDSDLEDSSEVEDSDSESDDEPEEKLLNNDDSDEENDQESEKFDEEVLPIPTNNMFITKQLEKLKYTQLKKIAGLTNNKLTKSELINQIAKDYKKVSILKALKFVS